MGLEKAIEHGKEKRKPYRDSRRFDYSCRNHGDCPWCEGKRLYPRRKMDEAARFDLQDWMAFLEERPYLRAMKMLSGVQEDFHEGD